MAEHRTTIEVVLAVKLFPFAEKRQHAINDTFVRRRVDNNIVRKELVGQSLVSEQLNCSQYRITERLHFVNAMVDNVNVLVPASMLKFIFCIKRLRAVFI
jgi:hypothetical protein